MIPKAAKKKGQTMQWYKGTKRRTMINKALHRKLSIEPRMNSCSAEE